MKPFRERNPVVVGLVSVAVLTVLMAFAFSLNRFTFFRGVYNVEADFADAAGLTPDNEVRVAGLKVGKVKSIELSRTDGQQATDRVRIAMEIDSGVELGSESEAEIKLKTILGQKFVDIVPQGGAPYVRDDQIIPLERTRVPFELYEVTNQSVGTIGQIDAKALNDALRQLGTLFEDPNGNLGRALRGLSKATKGLTAQEEELDELIRSGAEIVDVLASRSEALGRIFDSGAGLLEALASRGDALRRFVRGSDELARELSDLLRSTRSDLDPALEDLHEALALARKDRRPVEKAVAALGPSSRSFGRAFTQGRWGDIWLHSVFDLPVLPTLPVGTGSSEAAARTTTDSDLAAIVLSAAGGSGT